MYPWRARLQQVNMYKVLLHSHELAVCLPDCMFDGLVDHQYTGACLWLPAKVRDSCQHGKSYLHAQAAYLDRLRQRGTEVVISASSYQGAMS